MHSGILAARGCNGSITLTNAFQWHPKIVKNGGPSLIDWFQLDCYHFFSLKFPCHDSFSCGSRLLYRLFLMLHLRRRSWFQGLTMDELVSRAAPSACLYQKPISYRQVFTVWRRIDSGVDNRVSVVDTLISWGSAHLSSALTLGVREGRNLLRGQILLNIALTNTAHTKSASPPDDIWLPHLYTSPFLDNISQHLLICGREPGKVVPAFWPSSKSVDLYIEAAFKRGD
jgi:hypothetical protein